MTGRGKIDYNNVKLAFRECCQDFLRTKNNLELRTEGTIVLQRSNSITGYYFMSLSSGRRIHAS